MAESDRAVIIDDDSDDSNTDPPNRGKRQKILPPKDPAAAKKDGALVTVADELICPISHELPVDPVMALDGKIYERASIERWLKKHERSPLTGLAMGTKLTPVLQVRTIIEAVVTSGAIDEVVAGRPGCKTLRRKPNARHCLLAQNRATRMPSWSLLCSIMARERRKSVRSGLIAALGSVTLIAWRSTRSTCPQSLGIAFVHLPARCTI